VRDRGFQHGYGVFETVRVANGKAFRLNMHLARMREGARALAIEAPEVNERSFSALLEAWGRRDGVLKIIVTGGAPPDLEPTLLATASPPRPLPPGAREHGVPLGVETVGSLRPARQPLLSRFKLLSHADRVLIRSGARARGMYDALMIFAGTVFEGAGTNVFFVPRGRRTVCTPALELGIVEGTMRALVVELARESEIEVEFGTFPLSELEEAEEVFVTSALAGALPVSSIEGAPVGTPARFEIAHALNARVEALVAKECS
jgi:branched-subunit amino acid aminotransferase/4-amino-4-deoxychorismate lyase